MLEISPMPLPTANNPPRPGNTRVGFGLRASSICVAETARKTPKNAASDDVDIVPMICGPVSDPTMIPGARPATTRHSTAPCR